MTARPYLFLHIAVLLFGFTAILGKLITLSGASLTWWRMLITLGSLALFPAIFEKVREIPPRMRTRILGVGILVSLHWVTFFGAIKLSNVSVTLSVLASTAFFTSLIEPLVYRRKVEWHEILLGTLVIGGFVMIFGFTEGDMLAGILVAIASAILAAAFGVFNKTLVARYDVYAITLLEFMAGVGFLSLVLLGWAFTDPGMAFLPTLPDLGYLLLLALLCTTLAFTLTMQALRHLKAFTVALAINLEPIYGIVMAYFIFQEHKELNPGFYAGAGIILLAVFISPWLGRKKTNA